MRSLYRLSLAAAVAASLLACSHGPRGEEDFQRGPHVGAFFRSYPAAGHRLAAGHLAEARVAEALAEAAQGALTDENLQALLPTPEAAAAEPEKPGPETRALRGLLNKGYRHRLLSLDVLAAPLSDAERRRFTASVTRALQSSGEARSPAPLELTLRRAGVMLKPYFTYFRSTYPRTQAYFNAAAWAAPALEEASLLGRGAEQTRYVRETERLSELVFRDPPQRLPLGRELMPRYARLSPESANAFDNLHALRELALDILSYPGWAPAEKEAELARVARATAYQPGDEKLARKFTLPRPEVDPRRYEPWMKAPEGALGQIYGEILEEMMPTLVPAVSEGQKEQLVRQFQMKLAPGTQEGEAAGSLFEALRSVAPELRSLPGAAEPGAEALPLTQALHTGWAEAHAHAPDLAPLEAGPVPEPRAATVIEE